MGRHKESAGYWTQPYISLRQASTRTAAFDLAAVAALLPTFYPSFTVHIKVTFRLCSEKNPWILILKTNPTPLSAAGTGALEKTMRDYHCGIICTSDSMGRLSLWGHSPSPPYRYPGRMWLQIPSAPLQNYFQKFYLRCLSTSFWFVKWFCDIFYEMFELGGIFIFDDLVS